MYLTEAIEERKTPMERKLCHNSIGSFAAIGAFFGGFAGVPDVFPDRCFDDRFGCYGGNCRVLPADTQHAF